MRGVEDILTIAWLRENLEIRGPDVFWRVQSPRGHGRNLTAPAGYVNADGYRMIRAYVSGRKTHVYAHRVAFALNAGYWPSGHIDHADGNPANNDPQNLRDVSRAENNRNKRLSRLNTSGVSGVQQSGSGWAVSLGRSNRIGRYPTLESAVAARKEAERAAGYHLNHGRV